MPPIRSSLTSDLSSDLTSDEIIELLGLAPLPVEGGFFRVTHSSDRSSAIYFLMTPGGFSAMHRLIHPELWHWYAGAPAAMLLLDPDGGVREPVLGVGLAAGQRPQVMVDPGVYMGASTTGDWTLVGTTMAPPFTEVGLEFPTVAQLVERWPGAADRIASLVRDPA